MVVVGVEFSKKLQLPENPLGIYIQLGGEWFKVIGVLEEQGSFFGISRDNLAIIPYSTGKSILGSFGAPDFNIQLTIDELERSEHIKNSIRKILRKNHKLKNDEPDDFIVQSSQKLKENFDELTNLVTMVFGGIVSISLLVGGIGLMNIMLVSVTERTREIGICKALGARRKYIISQFLFEAILLTFFGAVLGIAIGFLLAEMITLIPGFPDTEIPPWSIALSIIFTTIIGVVFGILPAIKASNLSPIESLNYE